ncbi:MAG: putative signal transducing protein [Bacillota bacterium]
MAEEWVEVFRTTDQIEAEFMKGLLETSQIPVLMEAKGLKAMPYIFGHAASGQLLLKVPPDLAELARQILEAEAEPE